MFKRDKSNYWYLLPGAITALIVWVYCAIFISDFPEFACELFRNLARPTNCNYDIIKALHILNSILIGLMGLFAALVSKNYWKSSLVPISYFLTTFLLAVLLIGRFYLFSISLVVLSFLMLVGGLILNNLVVFILKKTCTSK